MELPSGFRDAKNTDQVCIIAKACTDRIRLQDNGLPKNTTLDLKSTIRK